MADCSLEDVCAPNARPLVTFALFAYNQEKYIRAAVEGALAQTYSPLEIILSDDCSTDSTFSIIESMVSDYSGPHTVVINRNPSNLGLVQHFNQTVARARGKIVVVAAGDDISLSTRVENTVEILNFAPEAMMMSFTDSHIDSDGHFLPSPQSRTLQDITRVTLNDYISGHGPFVSGASRAYKKKMFDAFGPLSPSCPTEDTPSLLRGLMMGDALVCPQPGINYRIHDFNLSRPQSLYSMKLDEIRDQYVRDANIALKEDLISRTTFNYLNAWIKDNHQRRSLTAGLYNSRNKHLFFFTKLIHSKHFSVRNKARMLIDVLCGR